MNDEQQPVDPELEASLVARLQARYGDALEEELSIELLPSITSTSDSAQPAGTSDSPVGTSDGRYAHGREIGRGGMGAILEVWDGNLARPLAMKVLLESTDRARNTTLVQRFVREARITGQLDHPGIVPVHDMGLDDGGRVYFTMRLVRGHELSHVFRDARAQRNGWNRGRALEVLLKICDTVAYAHTHGVVHRDLKPMNVMVGSFGEVYVLDWGLAKVVTVSDPDAAQASSVIIDTDDIEQTMIGTVLGTPSYMAPEQAAGLAATASPRVDVYAIGALLYALLAGRPPYVGDGEKPSSRDLIEAVRKGPPTPITELAPGAPDDLVAICERAMARDADKRYPSANEVADALREHMERERQAADESRRLRDQLQDSHVVSDFLKGLFRVDSPKEAETPVSMLEILERGANRIDSDLADNDAMRASVQATMGEVFQSIGAHSTSVPHLEQALDVARDHLARARKGITDGETESAERTVAHRVTHLALALFHTGAYERAEALFDEAIGICRRLDVLTTLGRALTGKMTLCWNTGRMGDAKPLLDEAVLLSDHIPDSIALSNRILQQGAIMESTGNIAAGEDALLQILEEIRSKHGRDDDACASVCVNLSVLSSFRRDHAATVKHCREALRIRVETAGPRHPNVALAHNNMGPSLWKLGFFDEAEDAIRTGMEIRADVFGPEHPNVGQGYLNLAHVAVARGELTAAEALIAQGQAIANNQAPNHPLHGLVERARAMLLEAQGHLDEAETAFKKAVEYADRTHEPLRELTLPDTMFLAEYYMRQERYDDAKPLLTRLQEVYATAFRPTDPIREQCETLLERARERS